MTLAQLNQTVTRTYRMGIRFIGADTKKRRNHEKIAVEIVRGYQQQLYEKLTPEKVQLALSEVKQNPSLSGTKGSAILRKKLGDCSNLGEAAYLPLLESVKGTIIREKKLLTAFDFLKEDPFSALEWYLFGRSPYIEGKLQYYYHHSHKYVSDLLVGARRKLDNYLPEKEQLVSSLFACSPKEFLVAIDSFHQKIIQQFDEIQQQPCEQGKKQGLSSAQKGFLNKITRLVKYSDELAELFYTWLVKWNTPEKAPAESKDVISNIHIKPIKSRWKCLNVFCQEVSEWLIAKGEKKTGKYAYRSTLRGILVTALLPHYNGGKTVVHLLQTDCEKDIIPPVSLVGLPFSKEKDNFIKKLPLHLLMGKRYVVERPGNAPEMTKIVQKTGKLSLGFWPYKKYRQRFYGMVHFHEKVLSFIQRGAKIKLLSLVAFDAPSNKLIVSVVLSGKYSYFLSAKKITALSTHIQANNAHFSNIRPDALGIDVNRLGEHMLAFSENVSIPLEVLTLVDKYHHLGKVISELSVGLTRRRRLFKQFSTSIRYHQWLKVKGELLRVYKRRHRLLQEIHRCCSQLTSAVVVALSVRLLCVEDLVLTAKGNRGALAKIILSLPDEADLFTRATRVAEWLTGNDITLVRVDPHGTSTNVVHYACPSSSSSFSGSKILKRQAIDSWDYVFCPVCGQTVNTHTNAACFIRDLGFKISLDRSDP